MTSFTCWQQYSKPSDVWGAEMLTLLLFEARITETYMMRELLMYLWFRQNKLFSWLFELCKWNNNVRFIQYYVLFVCVLFGVVWLSLNSNWFTWMLSDAVISVSAFCWLMYTYPFNKLFCVWIKLLVQKCCPISVTDCMGVFHLA